MPIPTEEYCVRMGQDIKTGGFWRDAFSELVATFCLVAVQVLLLQQYVDDNLQVAAIQVALGMALVAAAVGYGLGDFGGAHMNAAVTLALMVRAEISFLKGIVYWIMQGAGAIAAAFFVLAVTGQEAELGLTKLGEGVQWWQGMLIELFLTLMLCLTALGTQNIPRKGYIILPSLPVGLALGLGLFIGLPTTGGSLNPMRSLGPAVAVSVMRPDIPDIWSDHWVYWAGPMGGAFLAAIFYWIFDSVDRPQASIYDNSNTWLYNKSQSREPLTPPANGDLYPRAMMPAM